MAAAIHALRKKRRLEAELLRKEAEERAERMGEIFAKYDTDGSGRIDRAELLSVMVDLKVPVRAWQIDRLMRNFGDDNDDRTIDNRTTIGVDAFAQLLHSVEQHLARRHTTCGRLYATFSASCPSSAASRAAPSGAATSVRCACMRIGQFKGWWRP